MSVRILDRATSASKFRGALVGALLGDCLGAPFDHDNKVAKVVLQKYFDKMEDPSFKSPAKSYTDDTVMTKAVAESLINNGSFIETDIAKRFASNYFSPNEPDRNYGIHTCQVLQKLLNTNFSDIWYPARELFNGEGSYGSGGAMRITPIALFCYSNYELLLDNVVKCTKLTHTHRIGINGALLQAIAVNQSFFHLSTEPLNIDKFVNDLVDKMAKLEKIESDNIIIGPDLGIVMKGEVPTPFCNRLEEIRYLLKKKDLDDEEVVKKLGNGEDALNSVPTAIYCFLRSENPIKTVKTENKFRRAVQFSISLGGDTDTIGSLTGAISGAYHGYHSIDKNLQSHCEKLVESISLADQLHKIAIK